MSEKRFTHSSCFDILVVLVKWPLCSLDNDLYEMHIVSEHTAFLPPILNTCWTDKLQEASSWDNSRFCLSFSLFAS